MATKALVIVESPTKAKTIRKFLPKNYVVEASMGHVRDLPQSAADIPAKVKDQEWTKIGVNVDEDFSPLYIVPKGKFKIIQDLKKKMADADELYLATDEDREGESISWHLLEILKPKIPVKRMVFHEITKSAIEKALKDTREVDFRLVKAQESRRILDRLFGYTLSPLIWKKIAYGLSAGRVQSAGLRMIVQRERERIAFRSATYWDLKAKLKKGGTFEAKSVEVDGKKLATGKDFDETTGLLKSEKNLLVLDEKQAVRVEDALKTATWNVESVEEKEFTSRPAIPFITSTLQQEANRKLGWGARDAMRVAQALYEQGFITYMRTDSPTLSTEAIQGARNAVLALYGKEYLSPEPRQFSSKNKGAQEAHEAIRPAGGEFQTPADTGLSGRELALYELIWKRTVSCQMADAKKMSVTAKIMATASSSASGGATKVLFSSSGSRIIFPGFLRAYVEGSDDPEGALEDQEVLLPPLKVGDKCDLESISSDMHQTKPPARYTEASLVQALEKEGIGRPSTYASIIDTIQDRGYVRKAGNAMIPTFTGIAVIQLLEKNFSGFVDYKFTSQMEKSLDEIAEGTLEWLPYLKQFYLGKAGLSEQVKDQDKKIKPEESRTLDMHHIDGVEVKIGRYGAYLVRPGEEENDEVHATIPEDIAPGDLTKQQVEDLILASEKGPQPLGVDPKTGMNVYCLTGRFGPYVQLGETPPKVEKAKKVKGAKKDKNAPVIPEPPKPRRSSLQKGQEPKTLTLDQALLLLSLPRVLGNHPETGLPITTNIGRFGPYVVHEKDFRSLKKEDDVYTITLDRALELLKEEKKGRRGAQIVKELGKHPKDEKPIQIMAGKYGNYVSWGKVNATLPPEVPVEQVTLEKALELIKAKEELMPKGGRRRKAS